MPPSARIAIDPVIGFNVVGFFVAGFALVVGAFAVGQGRQPDWRGGRRCRDAANCAKQLPAPELALGLRFHRRVLPYRAAVQAVSANASVSIPIKSRPTAPTWR